MLDAITTPASVFVDDRSSFAQRRARNAVNVGDAFLVHCLLCAERMNRLVIAAVLLAIPTAARADADEPPPPPAPPGPPAFVDHPTLAGGTQVSVDHFLNLAWMLEGMLPLPRLPIAIHASASTGASADADNAGGFWRMTAGIEGRQCSDAGNCALLGLDLGYQHQTWGEDDPEEAEEHRGLLLGGRIGVDVGGEHVRFRAAFELYRYRREFVDYMTTPTTQYGGGFTMGLGYRM